MRTENENKCLKCNGTLKPFKNRNDWEERQYHLKCWKLIKFKTWKFTYFKGQERILNRINTLKNKISV